MVTFGLKRALLPEVGGSLYVMNLKVKLEIKIVAALYDLILW